ncbi:glycoside hydrolase family 16 protein [Tellurirhabdus rosea]|uniref:glycoside hydrolase family 16 protein n=1 Tax=Tellurirhabdus rosea TaxID=2674997 RepID=UPI00224CD564|nr:glycoside hydrolase family 16 protein [Tellurirhabdus rosea]
MKKINSAFLSTLLSGLLLLPGCRENGFQQAALPHDAGRLATRSAISPCEVPFNESALLREGWTKTFEDEFSRDLSRWNLWTGGAYNEELQHYQPSNLVLSNGILSIVAKRETVVGRTRPNLPEPKTFRFTSGRIESKTAFAPGGRVKELRISARIKCPGGYGMWPAFWAYGDPWPTKGEIDILEMRGNEPLKYTTNYAYGPRAGENQAPDATAVIQPGVSLTDCWHTFELIRARKTLTFLFDGRVVDVKQGRMVEELYTKPENIVLNLAIGGTFFGHPSPDQIVPGTMQVDWVKVFTK